MGAKREIPKSCCQHKKQSILCPFWKSSPGCHLAGLEAASGALCVCSPAFLPLLRPPPRCGRADPRRPPSAAPASTQEAAQPPPPGLHGGARPLKDTAPRAPPGPGTPAPSPPRAPFSPGGGERPLSGGSGSVKHQPSAVFAHTNGLLSKTETDIENKLMVTLGESGGIN